MSILSFELLTLLIFSICFLCFGKHSDFMLKGWHQEYFLCCQLSKWVKTWPKQYVRVKSNIISNFSSILPIPEKYFSYLTTESIHQLVTTFVHLLLVSGNLASSGFRLDLIYWKQLPNAAGNVVTASRTADLKTKTMTQKKTKDHLKLAEKQLFVIFPLFHHYKWLFFFAVIWYWCYRKCWLVQLLSTCILNFFFFLVKLSVPFKVKKSKTPETGHFFEIREFLLLDNVKQMR